MPLTPITNDTTSHVSINSMDVDDQVLDHTHRFTAQRGRVTTLASEPFGIGFKGEVQHTVALTYLIMKGDPDALAPYLASNPFDVACVWTIGTNCDVTGDYDFPDSGFRKAAGAPFNADGAVAISNGSFAIGWDDGTGS